MSSEAALLSGVNVPQEPARSVERLFIGPAQRLQRHEVFHQGTFRLSGMRSKLLAKQLPGAVVFRSSVGEDRVNDSGGLMSDSIGRCGMFRTGHQVIGNLFFGAS
ncbi:hypothetical protein SAMN04487913_11266 [Arthrobacter sp. ok362]|nr:hypothetical protein SAMN04487913_11266 [Arthrobacter sp. ok362]